MIRKAQSSFSEPLAGLIEHRDRVAAVLLIELAFLVRNPRNHNVFRPEQLRIGNRAVEIVAQRFVINEAADRLQSLRFEHIAKTPGAVAVVAPSLDFGKAEVPHMVQRERDVFLEMMAQTVELQAERTFETGARASLFARPGAVVQPYIDARRFPGVRLVEDVEVAIAVEIGEFALVKIVTGREDCLAEVALAVAIENPSLGLRIIRVGALLGPLRHFGRKNVEMPVTVHVTYVEGMAVNHVPIKQIVSNPVAFFQRITGALIPAQWTGAVAWRDHDLRMLR